MAERTRVVLVICDGLRHDMVDAASCPAITQIAKGGTRFCGHQAVFPSVTRVSSASIATGQMPGIHGLSGNKMGLPDGDGITIHDAGLPEFVETMRDALGRTLLVPTLAERLTAAGGAVLYSNVSPGAAYFHDPDGYGAVYHRAGSTELRRRAAPPLPVAPTLAGDTEMTARFCADVLERRRPRLATLWLANPDSTGHRAALGSDSHYAAIANADRCVATVAETVSRLRAEGEDILLIVGADHGMETVRQTIPIEQHLLKAGLKRRNADNHIAVAPQGSGALIYATHPVSSAQVSEIASYLTEQPWTRAVFADDALRSIGQAAVGGLRIAVSMARSDDPNAHGIKGTTDVATRFEEEPEQVGFGQHGGLGRYETAPFLLANGPGFRAGDMSNAPTRLIDIAPTILKHLKLPAHGLPGRALQNRLGNGASIDTSARGPG